MLTDLIRAIDYSDCAEAALVLFCLAFAMMCYATWRLTRQASEAFSTIPLIDDIQEPRIDTTEPTQDAT